jgi:hypothetical protein
VQPNSLPRAEGTSDTLENSDGSPNSNTNRSADLKEVSSQKNLSDSNNTMVAYKTDTMEEE